MVVILLHSHNKICPKKPADTSVAIFSLLNGPLGIRLQYRYHHQSADHHVHLHRVRDRSSLLFHTIVEQEEQRKELVMCVDITTVACISEAPGARVRCIEVQRHTLRSYSSSHGNGYGGAYLLPRRTSRDKEQRTV